MKTFIQDEANRLTSKPSVCKLSDCRILRCSGNDAARFLNGQLSQNMLTLTEGSALRACLLTVKGRLVALPTCWRAKEDFYLEIPETQVDSTLARLEKYIVADDVSFSDITETSAGLHIIGPNIQLKMDQANFRNQFRRFGVGGIDLWFASASERDQFFVMLLDQGMHKLSFNETEFLRIVSRTPRWGAELDENVLPVEAGLDRIAVDFHKGCYMGQEVVSRMETAGRMRRELVFWSSFALFKTLEDAKIFCDGVDSGWITSWTLASTGSVGLAYLKSPVHVEQRYEIRMDPNLMGMTVDIEARNEHCENA